MEYRNSLEENLLELTTLNWEEVAGMDIEVLEFYSGSSLRNF
jgi:hypothetical protein